MQISRENFRAMIFYDFKSHLTGKQSIERLHSAFGDEAPSNATVYNWFSEFQRGRTYLSDEFREGRPATSVNQENIDAVRKLIEEDRKITYYEIQQTLGIDVKQIHTILHDKLNVRKLCARWIPHKLTDAEKKARVDWCKKMIKKYRQGASNLVYNIVTGDETWIYCYEPESKAQSKVWVFRSERKPKKVVRSRSTSRKMIAIFFGITGCVATVPLEDRRTVNADWYTNVCLPEIINEIRKNNPNRRIILHHDNASSHSAHKTNDFLKANNVELMTHCPYSPDLSPNDFFLFSLIKKKMRGKRFSTPEEAIDAFKMHVSEIPSSGWKNCFKDWFDRMKKCIDYKGEYFEKK